MYRVKVEESFGDIVHVEEEFSFLGLTGSSLGTSRIRLLAFLNPLTIFPKRTRGSWISDLRRKIDSCSVPSLFSSS